MMYKIVALIVGFLGSYAYSVILIKTTCMLTTKKSYFFSVLMRYSVVLATVIIPLLKGYIVWWLLGFVAGQLYYLQKIGRLDEGIRF